MKEEILALKRWLGAGSINVFGLPMSGKDTVGVKLAELLEAKFLSSGMIIREMEARSGQNMTDQGLLVPKNVFFEYVLPYFGLEELKGQPLILSSVGRWDGEENEVIPAAEAGGHPIRVAVHLDLSEEDVFKRWKAVQETGDVERGVRLDDKTEEIFEKRIEEFRTKTEPVLKHYEEMGRLVKVPAGGTKEEVMKEVLRALVEFSREN